MTTNPTPEPAVDRIPLAHSVRYVARGLPEVPNQYGPGVLAPSEITLTYRAAPDSGLGRVHAYVAGRIWVDGTELPLMTGGLYGQHYDDGLDDWPAWLAEEARLHDPAASAVVAVAAPPTEQTAALTDAERTMLTYALDQAQEHIWSRDGFTDEDQAAVTSLRRLAAETQPPEPVKLPFVHTDDDGDRLTIGAVMASTYDGEAPVVAVAAEQYHGDETATVYVRPERVEQVVTALRAARQAAEALPAAASAGVQTDEETSNG